jgi:dTDP-4-amino-4,6-dideoxy-D-galactose acyltransferase
LALLSGQQSRFRTDHRLPKGSFERLYQQWLVNSLQDQKSSVLISGKEHAPDGLITVAWGQSQAVIGLLAVRQAVQGAGIGSRLLNAVDGEAVRHGARELAVKTQGINQRACSLYLRNGYRETERYELYHFHLS